MAKNVSNQFKNIIKNGGPFYAYAAVTFADGSQTIMNSKTDFMATGNGYSESSEAGFPLGVAISKTITLNIDNTTAYESIQDTEGRHIQDTTGEDILANKKSVEEDYYNARIVLYTEADLPDGTQERVQEGIFTVIDSVRPDEVLEITAYDDMYKADVAFYSSLTYPVSVQMLLNEVCNFCDITLGSATFKNNDYQIHQAPQNLTARQVIGYIAQIAGGNAVIDRNGRLVIKSYDLSGFDASEEISSDEIESESGIHIFSRFTSAPDIGVADVIITGVSTEVEDENGEDEVYLVGTEEYAISVDNPLITGNEQDAVNRIAESIMGLRMRPFSGNFLPDPTVEFMDLCYVIDRKDNIYKSFVTLHDFDYLGGSMFANETESPQKFGGTYYSEAAQAYQKAKEDIKNNKKQWEQAIENLTQQVANASGFYTTTAEQDDGSIIFYLHNKPTLEESNYVWKMTSETLSVSTDGGEHWNGGITVNGEVIATIMNTIGLNFDWGVGGTLIIQDKGGTQTFYANTETGVVRIIADEFSLTNGDTIDSIAEDYANSAYENSVQYTEQQLQDYEPNLTQESVFNALTNNGQAQGIFIRNGQLYINMSYAQSGTLKLGGSNNVNGLLQVYNSRGVLVGTIDNIGAKFTNGSDWLQISQSLLTGGYGSTTDGILDLSANYSTGRHVVLESKTGDVILKSADDFRVQRQSGGMGYLVQSGGTDYFDDIGVSFGDTYPVIGIMYGEDDISGDPFLDIRLSNGRKEVFSASSGSSVDPGYGYMDDPIFGTTTTTTLTCRSTMEVSGNIFCSGTTILYKAPQFFNVSHVTSGGHLVFAADGSTVAYLASSSKRYKDHIRDLDDEEALSILDIPVVVFKYKDGYLVKGDLLEGKPIPGFYAEDVEEVAPILCQYNLDGSVEDWNYRTMIPYMVKTMQIQQKQIDNLQTQINELKTMILNMKGA